MNKFFQLFVPKENKRLKTNRYMLYSSMLIVLVFFGMMAYLVRFVAYDSQTTIANVHNKRTATFSERVIRGDIRSADGQILAKTVPGEDGKELREYPFGDTFAHVVGYNSSQHGKTGLESLCNYTLLTSHTPIMQKIRNGWDGVKNQGDSVVTSLDTRLQQAASDALGSYKGAIIVIEPSSGRILSLVSKPDFNPNDLDSIWEDINADDSNSCLVNRATQGLYPPGSTYKIITAIEYMREHPEDYGDFSYDCEGETIVQSVHISCYEGEVHGKVDLKEAFTHSCNTAFVTMGSQLHIEDFVKTNEALLFNQSIDSDIKIRQSEFHLKEDSDESQMPQTVIGQGETLMTPMHNTLIMSAIANKGILMRPRLIDYYVTSEDYIINESEAKEYKELFSKEEAKHMRRLLRNVVEEGTAYALQSDRFIAGGKTGTAENSGENSHSWFVGYAGNKENKADIVITVLVENTGAGSQYAAPIARRVIDAYYDITEGN